MSLDGLRHVHAIGSFAGRLAEKLHPRFLDARVVFRGLGERQERLEIAGEVQLSRPELREPDAGEAAKLQPAGFDRADERVRS